jgi:myosin I
MNEIFIFFINLQKLLHRIIEVFFSFILFEINTYLDRFGVQRPESYLYTSRSKCYSADGIDDQADFTSTLRAMQTIGLSQQEIDDIFKMLASILWLGNVQFVENNEGNAQIADESVPTYVAYLLDVDAAMVDKVLLPLKKTCLF